MCECGLYGKARVAAMPQGVVMFAAECGDQKAAAGFCANRPANIQADKIFSPSFPISSRVSGRRLTTSRGAATAVTSSDSGICNEITPTKDN